MARMRNKEEMGAGIGEQEYGREKIERGEIGHDKKSTPGKDFDNSSYLVYYLPGKSPPGPRWERASKGKEVSSQNGERPGEAGRGILSE